MTRYPNREQFLAYLDDKKWPRWNYPFYQKERFHNFINDVLGDCIEGENGHIAYLEDRTRLAVTDKGREFIKLGGFIQAYLKKHDRLVVFIFGSGGMAAIIWLIVYFWNLLRAIFNRYVVAIIIFSISFGPAVVLAHPGRTDASGCHTCRTNCPNWGLSYGEYHCHRSKGSPQPKEPIKSHLNKNGTGYTEPAPEYKVPATVQSSQNATQTEKNQGSWFRRFFRIFGI